MLDRAKQFIMEHNVIVLFSLLVGIFSISRGDLPP